MFLHLPLFCISKKHKVLGFAQLEIHPISKDDFDFLIMGLFYLKLKS